MFRYYLLGGDTVVPSGLYDRLCHAFLVAFKTFDILQGSVETHLRCGVIFSDSII